MDNQPDILDERFDVSLSCGHEVAVLGLVAGLAIARPGVISTVCDECHGPRAIESVTGRAA